jgi:WD40-like Beta Propeller Repeat
MSKPSSSPPSSSQPKISQKLILRTAVFLFALAGLFYGFRYLKDKAGDFNSGSSNTAGDIAAIQEENDGAKLVIIHPDGTVIGTKSWASGNTDRDLAWAPSGRFIYFTSDRDGQTYHIYRWNPDQDDPEVQTGDKRARSSLTFPAEASSDADERCLNVSGGYVQAFDLKTKATPAVLPPVTQEITQSTSEDSGGMEAGFDVMFGGLGTAFRYARYCKGGSYIAAILEREGGEVLILQKMQSTDGKLSHPIPVAAGDHVEFDVNPKDGTVVYTVENFKWPDPEHVPAQFIKNNQVTYPYRHVVGIADPDAGPQGPVVISKDDKAAFEQPAISPDGSTLLLVEGPYDASTSEIKPVAILTLPCKPGGIAAQSRLVEGQATDPCWSPDGETIAFTMFGGGHRDLYTITKTGTDQKNVTNGKGDFSHPAFSPAMPTEKS